MPKGVYDHSVRKNYKHSEETRIKIGLGNKGKIVSGISRKKISDAHKGLPSNHTGKKHSKETIEKFKKIRNTKEWRNKVYTEAFRIKISKALKGKNSYNWKGGISKEYKIIRGNVEFKIWREKVFARDDYTCHKCKRRGLKLHPHHIKNFAEYIELRFDVDNGITFCEDCHIEFHKKYGFKNNNRSQLNSYLEIFNKIM